MTSGRPRDERGSLTVELVVVTPVLFLMALTVIVFGRVSVAHQQVIEASRAAAEAAAVEPTAASAQSGAADIAVIGGFTGSQACVHAAISTNVGHFYPGGYVRVTVTCQVSLSDVGVPGMPGTTTISSSSIAPIDPYRSIR
jgi:Flp pilus assembly protein TadG